MATVTNRLYLSAPGLPIPNVVVSYSYQLWIQTTTLTNPRVLKDLKKRRTDSPSNSSVSCVWVQSCVCVYLCGMFMSHIVNICMLDSTIESNPKAKFRFNSEKQGGVKWLEQNGTQMAQWQLWPSLSKVSPWGGRIGNTFEIPCQACHCANLCHLSKTSSSTSIYL